MRTRQRRAEQPPVPTPPRDDAEDPQEAQAERGAALLAAADAAITRALSGNSSEYLAQNRQLGGQ